MFLMPDQNIIKSLSIVLIIIFGQFLSCEPFATQFEDLEDGIFYYSKTIENPPAQINGLKVIYKKN